MRACLGPCDTGSFIAIAVHGVAAAWVLGLSAVCVCRATYCSQNEHSYFEDNGRTEPRASNTKFDRTVVVVLVAVVDLATTYKMFVCMQHAYCTLECVP